MRCAGEPEGGLDCAAVPGGNGSRIGGDGQCLAPVCWAGEQDLPSGLAREIGAGSAWQEQDDAGETWLEDAFKSSVGCCLVGSAHSHLQTRRGGGCISQS